MDQEHVGAGGEKQNPGKRAQTPVLAADGCEIDQHKYDRQGRCEKDNGRQEVAAEPSETLDSPVTELRTIAIYR